MNQSLEEMLNDRPLYAFDTPGFWSSFDPQERGIS